MDIHWHFFEIYTKYLKAKGHSLKIQMDLITLVYIYIYYLEYLGIFEGALYNLFNSYRGGKLLMPIAVKKDPPLHEYI